MSAKTRSFCKLTLSVAIFCVLSTATVMMHGQSATTQPATPPTTSKPAVGVPDDWTHHHLVFSNPGSFTDAVTKGKVEKWNKINNDRRYQLQQLKRNILQRNLTGATDYAARTAMVSASTAATAAATSNAKKNGPPSAPVNKDWSMDVAGGAAATSTGTVGTLSGASISGASTLTVDTVTFDASAPTASTQTGVFTAAPTAFNNPAITVVNAGNSNTLSLTTNATGAYATGTFTQAPKSNTTIGVTSNTTSVTNLVTNATASSATATINGVPNSTATMATIVSGASTVNLAPNAAATTATGTFSGLPTGATSIVIGSGANTLTMTPNATAASTSVTVNAVPTSASTTVLSIANGAGTVNMTPSGATASTITGTFLGVPTSTANPTITISQGAGPTTTTLTTAASAASSSVTVNAVPTAAGTAALTIVNGGGTIHMTPSGATASTVTGTFGAVPTSATEPTITINQGAAITTLTNSATAASSLVTVNAVPTAAGTAALTIVNGGGTIHMTPTGATSSTVTGTFVGIPTSTANPTITINQGAGPTITTLTNAATAGATTVTVAAVPTSASTAALTIVNGGGTIHMTPSGATASTATGTFTAVPTSATAPTITIIQGAGPTTTTLTTGATTSSATATFTGTGTTATARIVNSTTPTGVTFTGATGGGTITVTGTTVTSRTLTVGASPTVTYSFATTCTTGTVVCVPAGSTTTTIAENIEAAINNQPSQCGLPSGGPCYGSGITAAAGGVTASIVTAPTINVTVTSGTPSFYLSATSIMLTTSPANVGSGTISAAVNACSSATAGTFVVGASAAASATNLYTAIMDTSCQTTTPIGVTASNPGAGATFTITGTLLGYATFTAGGTGLTLTAAGGNAAANGTTACTGTTGTFALAAASTVPTTALEAAQLKTALSDCTGTGLTGGTVAGSSLPVTQSALGYDTNFAVASTQTGTFSWGAVTFGSNGTGNACSGGPTIAGTFLLAPASTLPTTTTVAAQLGAAIALCPATAGVSQNYSAGNSFAVTNTVLGYSTFAGLTGIVTVSATSGGSNGTTACSGTTGTFALAAATTIPTTALEIAQLKTALGLCTGTGVTGGTVAGSSLPVTETALGDDTNFAVASTQTSIFSWGAVTIGSNGTGNACSTPTAGTFVLAPPSTLPTTTTVAAALGAAIALCPASAGVSQNYSAGNSFTVTNTVLGYSTFAGLAGIVTVGSASGGSNGATACTGTTGTFALASSGTTVPTTALEIAQLKTALGLCTGTGVTGGTVAGSSLPVTDTSLGDDTTFTVASTQTGTFSWGAVTYGSNGTANACTTPTAGTFLLAPASTPPTTTTVAAQLGAAIALCPASAGVSQNYSAGNSFTVTNTVLGYSTFAGLAGIVTVGSASGGSNGTTACSGTTGTFALAAASTIPTTALEIAQLKTALGLCTGTGVTGGTVSGSSLPVTDTALGYDTSLTAASTQTSIFNWGAPIYGSNGTANACTGTSPIAGTFQLAPGSTLPTTSTVASGLTTAIGMCPTAAGVGFNTLSTNTFNVADTALGYATFTGLSGIVTVSPTSGGTNGSNACSSISGGTFAIGNSGAVPTTALMASNLRTAINDCPTGTGVSATYTTGSAFTATDTSILGYDTNFTVSGNQTGVFAWTGPTYGSNGSNTCTATTSPFNATFELNTAGALPTTSTMATQMAAAINLCSAAAGVSAGSVSTNTFVETDTALGPGSFTGTANLSWSNIVSGNNGTGPSCTGTGPYTANYLVGQTVASLAQNMVAAINSCPVGAAIVGTYTAGGAFRVANSTFGSAATTLTTATTNNTNIFTWSTTTAGTTGTSACTGNTTGTYIYSATLATLATDLSTTIGRCTAATTGITSTTTGAPANGILVTSNTLGSTGGNNITLGGGSGVFTWTGTTLSGGTDGTTSGISTPPKFAYWSGNTYASPSQVATNIATALGQNATTSVDVSAAPSGATVVVSSITGGNLTVAKNGSFSAFTWVPTGTISPGGAATMGAGNYPAKYSFSTTDAGNCGGTAQPDYVVYNTGAVGSTTSANIIAYDNIYSGCGGTVPTVYWSYFTGSGTVATSPVLSLDGTKVAFIESGSPSGSATLRIIQWNGGEGSDYKSPVAPKNLYTNPGSGAAWSTCPAGESCMISVPFQAAGTHGNTDTISSPWYDYDSDTLWVGDSGGYLHEFTNVFGTVNPSVGPAEVNNGTWPVLVYAAHALASPVLDNAQGYLFVGDSGGFFNAVSTAGAYTPPFAPIGLAVNDGPLVDVTAGTQYVAVSCDESTTALCSSDPGTSEIYQFNYTGGLLTEGDQVSLGTYSTSIPIYAGTFDNTYYLNEGATPTGTIWICGNPGGNPTLYAVTILNGTMTSATAGPKVSSATGTSATCSPVSEFYNGTTDTDYVFVSPQNEGTPVAATGCTASVGCVISYTVSGTSATLAGAGPFAGGASGMVVDTQTTSGTLTTNQLYFGLLGSGACSGNGSAGSGTGGCAIQAAQAGP